MAQLTGDTFAGGQALLPLDEAVRLLFERIPALADTEVVSLADADGRILAAPLVATLNLPGFDNSAVDGYAVRFADLSDGETVLPVVGRIAAGHAPHESPGPGVAIRIFTGAPLPPGFDTVFMQEDCRQDDAGTVVLPRGLVKGANARSKGEDVACGATVLGAGRRLAPESIALAAALGAATLTVRRALRVAIFSTGDEIMSPGETLRPAAIYDANRFFLLALLKRLGVAVTDLGILPDTEDAIRRALDAAAPAHDLLLTSGGVSTGEEDHVKAAVAGAGSLVFWRVAIKPGRPVALGVIQGTPFVGLPGNPVAVFVTFAAIVRPLLAALAGETWTPPIPLPVASGFAYRKKKGRREYVRVTLARDATGRLVAQNYPVEGAGVLTSLTESDGLVELGEDVVTVAPGDVVAFLSYAALR
ncbi:gephyrin-like molybdotransferase Glp [Beijerinckia sp. L45]|uniref:molybdopterin molybdotransferase MoeA n=1 Tax=Beijerinckia sp. L45 TaxID=1641855 RepID=UPI00131E3919|nr:gephyrin-like molybdotransferase Glp [Beijerinckia sp. L45]